MKAKDRTESVYYFVSYTWRRFRPSSERHYQECVLNGQHPVDWLIETREKHGDNTEYSLLSWHEISAEQYQKWNGNL